MVRVLLKGDMQQGYHLLVEDDGHGIDENVETDNKTGEHVGLSTMHERAEQIKAELSIESEPGEGTRIELNFKWQEK